MVLSNMCAFGDPEAKAIVNEIVEEMAVKRGVKRSVEELVGDDTMSKYVACLRVPDWKLVLFQAMARVSSKTWQSVINITGLTVFSRSAGGRRFRRLLVYQAPATHVKQKQRKIIL